MTFYEQVVNRIHFKYPARLILNEIYARSQFLLIRLMTMKHEETTKVTKVTKVKPVGNVTKQATVTLGGYRSPVDAKRDSEEFTGPTIFLDRSALFPSPTAFNVMPSIQSATSGEWAEGAVPHHGAQHYVKFTMIVTGLSQYVDAWLADMQGRMNAYADRLDIEIRDVPKLTELRRGGGKRKAKRCVT